VRPAQIKRRLADARERGRPLVDPENEPDLIQVPKLLDRIVPTDEAFMLLANAVLPRRDLIEGAARRIQ